jgi:hypothetical protein
VRQFAIPVELLQLLGERRVIPFIGAGFSSTNSFPGWNDMLRRLAADIDSPLRFDEIHEACRGDPLQIAEYLFLIGGATMGPLRQSLSGQLQANQPLVKSGPHVELVNLGAPQVYTTNYDDLIEKTYRLLSQRVAVVALPRDVAVSHGEATTQVVKYHGDLRYEQTIVLTECQYYARLDFESPMDLKFRSDLLGRSVLFVGYSFQDLNIRIIWFKLRQMMKDVSQGERIASYIVRFEPNEVLETLNASVGLTTIVIDPSATATTADEKNALLAEFMLSLSMQASAEAKIPLTGKPVFASSALLDSLRDALAEKPASAGYSSSRSLLRADLPGLIDRLARCRIPDDLRPEWHDIFVRLISSSDLWDTDSSLVAALVIRYSEEYGASRALTLNVALALMSSSASSALSSRLEHGLDWTRVWQRTLKPDDAEQLITRVEHELEAHQERGSTGPDLAYAIDIVIRLVAGQLTESPLDGELLVRAQAVLDRSADLYPQARDHEPSPDGPPRVETLLSRLQDSRQMSPAHNPPPPRPP